MKDRMGSWKKRLAAFRRGARRPVSPPSPAEKLAMLARMAGQTADEEVGCDEVYELLDQYADLVARGEDPSVLLPTVHHHLMLCRDCKEELEALLRILTGGQP